jgi:hypothetical protein
VGLSIENLIRGIWPYIVLGLLILGGPDSLLGALDVAALALPSRMLGKVAES